MTYRSRARDKNVGFAGEWTRGRKNKKNNCPTKKNLAKEITKITKLEVLAKREVEEKMITLKRNYHFPRRLDPGEGK